MSSGTSLGIIIPTKDRVEGLANILASIKDQDYKPARIIVVDGGVLPVERLVRDFPGMKIEYMRQLPASLTVQRNVGIRRIFKDVSIIAFFDDDVILDDGCLKNMMKFWEGAAPDVGGAGFNITNVSEGRPTVLQKIFMVNADKPGRILKSGFQSRIPPIDETSQVEWVVGCAMTWRSSIFNEFMFDEWFSGYARYEEVDFGYRVGRKYRIYLVADAKVRHMNSLEEISFSAPLGKMEVLNRLYFVRKNPPLSPALCLWALFGLLLNNILKGLFGFDKRYIYRALGNLAGFKAALLKR
ncbi:MAG: glycosyltransferase [Candidatus Omnitrophica bacterium]|nr:glycosyltransferase [Candidatus Omnitrophota bacterium]MCM8790585.1 glycosyltransferase [Candidatus Omnitrophota bacterium]